MKWDLFLFTSLTSTFPYFPVVLTACNPNACRASGRGLQQKGLRVKEVADFKVYTKGGGSGELKVTVKGPSKTPQTHPFKPRLHQYVRIITNNNYKLARMWEHIFFKEVVTTEYVVILESDC